MTERTFSLIIDGVCRPSPYFTRSSPVGLILLIAAVATISSACATAPLSADDYPIAETIESGGWRLTVHGFYQLPPDRWYEPADGQIHCAVEVTLENVSGRILFVMPEKQMLLLDGDGRGWAPDRSAAVVAARSWGWIAPEGELSVGEKAHGAVSYQVPQASLPTRWVFRTGLLPWSRRITFAVGRPQQR